MEIGRQEPKSYWLKMSEGLAESAEKARIAGDVAASINLALLAAQYLQVARNLDRGYSHLPTPPKEQ